MTTPNVARPSVSDNAGTRAPRPKERRWGSGGRGDPIAAYVAPQLGMRPQAVGHLMRDIGPRCAAIVSAFVALGDTARGERFIRPILTAWDGRTAPPLCDAVLRLAQEADTAEDLAETDFLLDRSDQNLDRLIRVSDRAILRETARRDALVQEQQRRRGSR
jgi:hypothetical protein